MAVERPRRLSEKAIYESQWTAAKEVQVPDLRRIWTDSLFRFEKAVMMETNKGSLAKEEIEAVRHVIAAIMNSDARYCLTESGTFLALNFPGQALKEEYATELSVDGEEEDYSYSVWQLQIAVANGELASLVKRLIEPDSACRWLFSRCVFEKLSDEMIYEFAEAPESNRIDFRLVSTEKYGAFGIANWQDIWGRSATYFMKALEDWSLSKQAPAMMLEVGTENTAAITLYEKLGYENISTRKGYYGPGLDAFVMRKELIS